MRPDYHTSVAQSHRGVLEVGTTSALVHVIPSVVLEQPIDDELLNRALLQDDFCAMGMTCDCGKRSSQCQSPASKRHTHLSKQRQVGPWGRVPRDGVSPQP